MISKMILPYSHLTLVTHMKNWKNYVYLEKKKFKCLYNMLPLYICIVSNMICYRKNWDNLMTYMIDVILILKQLQKQKGINKNRENSITKAEASYIKKNNKMRNYNREDNKDKRLGYKCKKREQYNKVNNIHNKNIKYISSDNGTEFKKDN